MDVKRYALYAGHRLRLGLRPQRLNLENNSSVGAFQGRVTKRYRLASRQDECDLRRLRRLDVCHILCGGCPLWVAIASSTCKRNFFSLFFDPPRWRLDRKKTHFRDQRYALYAGHRLRPQRLNLDNNSSVGAFQGRVTKRYLSAANAAVWVQSPLFGV